MQRKAEVKNDPQAYACRNKDESVRLLSSSGGLFTLIAGQIISNRGVVFGASFNHDFTVSHSYVETMENLEGLRGSKYVQSKIGDTYKQIKGFLSQGQLVLFSGTPCQIGGLKAYLQNDYEKLFCVDIICHGVPSPEVWQKYVAYREKRAKSPTRRISFRRKDEGWKRFSVSFSFENNTEYLQTLDKDLYMQAFLRDICLRPSCHACNFKTLHRQSDITLADFWGIQHILPEMDDDKGTSLLLLNSNSGKKMFECIKNQIVYQEVVMSHAIAYNQPAIKSALQNPKRKTFFKELDQMAFDKLVSRHCTDTAIVRAKKRVKFMVYSVLKSLGLLNALQKLRR
jgi:coenzyme F420-reducing hydrogenase beta subunit